MLKDYLKRFRTRKELRNYIRENCNDLIHGYHIYIQQPITYQPLLLCGTNPYLHTIRLGNLWIDMLYSAYPLFRESLRFTLAHEVGHSVCRKHPKVLPLAKDRKFVNWTEEIFCDYYGYQKGLLGDYDIASQNIELKRSLKLRKYNKDLPTVTHPSWDTRRTFILKDQFNEDTIDSLAMITGCRNLKLIRQTKDFYRPFFL